MLIVPFCVCCLFCKTQYWNPFFFNFMNNFIKKKQLSTFGNTSLPKKYLDKTKQTKKCT